MSWYVIEGPDDTGKTTLARLLESRGWVYQHADASDQFPVLTQRMAMLQDTENVVWDRAHLGEIVHSKVDRNDKPVPQGWRRLTEAFLLEREAEAVLLTERVGRDHENDRERHLLLEDEFHAAASRSFLNWTRGYPSLPVYPEESEYLWSLWRPDCEGLGAGRPMVWVLGEVQNENATVPWPLATRCGLELVWPVIDPKYVRVSNAIPSWWREFTANPHTDLHERWEKIGRPRVVALGRVTFEQCHRADIPVFRSLPHPQYWLRFHSRELGRYKLDLERAILEGERAALEVIPT